jgi:hypothetical protein
MIYESLSVPRWISEGIKPNHKGARLEKVIYGGDTETVRGKPLSMQFYSEDIACNEIIFCNENTALDKFLKWCSKRPRRMLHVVYIHNLSFDLIELLWGSHERLIENGGEFSFTANGFDIRGLYGTPTFCTLRKGSDISIILADSFSFYRGSLLAASALYCPTLPKLRRPVGLGEQTFRTSDADFVEYAMRDAQVTYHIGKAIEELHSEFDLKQCVSIADLAARVFRHRFLTYTIPAPSSDIVYASLDAYHGGKNNITVTPGFYQGVHGIDISSAYPHAMRDMPAFSNGKLYKQYRSVRTRKNRIARVPEYGVYCIMGTVDACRWPCVFDHAFKALRGGIENTWVQGWELNEALRSGELRISHIHGYYYDHDKDHQAPALRAFCDDFYQRKQTEKDKVRRYGYKLILNSISGKFIQTRKKTLKAYVDADTKEVCSASELVAGGMFHPFIAAAITAHTRARIHTLEHQYQALHTATDGIFTQQKLDSGIQRDATRLGELTNDSNGELLLVRNKCYIMYDKAGEKPSSVYEGKRISKYALHGFQGSVEDLERLISSGERTYTIHKPNKLKSSIARGLTPNDFAERHMTLNVGPI